VQAKDVFFVLLIVALLAAVIYCWTSKGPNSNEGSQGTVVPGADVPTEVDGAFAVAEVVLTTTRGQCGIHRASSRSFAWTGSPHIWLIRNHCEQEMAVRIVDIQKMGRPFDPFEEGPREVSVPGQKSQILMLRVVEAEDEDEEDPTGEYEYEIEANGARTQSNIDIRDPNGFSP
jgi:hypothetical protein